MQIALECLFGWDPARQKGKPGIFGQLEAFCRADEEQGRSTLHAHWLVWVKKFGKLRRLLFAKDEGTRKLARASYISYINKVMSVAQCDFEVEITRECSCGGTGRVNDMYENCDPEVLRKARHETGCSSIGGKVMRCVECKTEVATSDITDSMLKSMCQEEGVRLFSVPMSKNLLDITTYRSIYDHGIDESVDLNAQARYLLQNKRMNEHCVLHTRSCHKYGCECRHCLPCLATSEDANQSDESEYKKELGEDQKHLATELAKNTGTRIYEGNEPVVVVRHTLDGDRCDENRFSIDIHRPQGSQYMNTYNVVLSRLFNCNTNVAAGDSGQTFYQTVYETKNTQSDDREPRDIIAKSVIRRLIRAQRESEDRQSRGEEVEEEVDTWVEGLARVLSGINAATSRTVISAPMSHNLALNKGMRFHFSHEFAELLVGQMEDVLEGKRVTFIVRRCSENEIDKKWEDISANDYLFRPTDLDDYCFYHQTMEYTKQYKQKGYNTEDGEAVQDNMKLGDGHPGQGFAYLGKLQNPRIPVTSIPKDKLCRIEELEINNANPTEETRMKRENYAKMALLMFCPFRILEDLKHDESYWEKFDIFRRKHFINSSLLHGDDDDDDRTKSISEGYLSVIENEDTSTFWMKGFEILQNIEDRMSVEKCHGRAVDVLTDNTEEYISDDTTNMKASADPENDDSSVRSISYYCDELDDEMSVYNDCGESYDRYSHNNLIERELNTTDGRLLDARLASDASVIFDDMAPNNSGVTQAAKSNEADTIETDTSGQAQEQPNVLRLIKGSLLGGNGTYEDVYPSDPDEGGARFDSATENDGPTLRGVARKVWKEEGKRLDENQYIMYEVIACSFLLGLLNDSNHNHEQSLEFQNQLRAAAGIIGDIKEVETALIERGGREQLIMFVTGFAGAGKSTAIKVAQRFCFEFCAAASIMWNDNTFMFTAYTGSAAAAFGGQTTVSATYLSKEMISDDDRKAFEGVRTIIIDEVSFLKDTELKKLSYNLQKIGDSSKVYGGYNIIFAGDFQQNEPVRMKEREKLWHQSSSRLFEDNINCCIILDGLHRFKDDEEYGRILQRLCRGKLTQDDVDRINTRLVGRNGVVLPKVLEGDSCYACSTNSERNAVTAGIFREHLQATHPDAGSDEVPPKHTIIIKGLVESPSRSSKKVDRALHKRITELGDCDMKQGTKLISPHLCCYNGAYFMCNSNDGLKENGTANGSQARLLRVKLVSNPKSYKCEVWDSKKVWTVCASDVEFLEFEHHPQRKGKSKLFRLKPKKMSVTVNVLPHDDVSQSSRVLMKCKVTQIPVNSSDAITGHKLQGLTKDNVIVFSWNKSTNWIYVVLSRVRTLSGLYLFRALRLKDIKPPSREYFAFLDRMRSMQRWEIERSRRRASGTNGGME